MSSDPHVSVGNSLTVAIMNATQQRLENRYDEMRKRTERIGTNIESPSDVVSLPSSSSVNFFNAGKDAALQKVVDQLKVGYQLYESNKYLKCGTAQAKAYMEQFRKKYTQFKEAQGAKRASTQQHKPIGMTNLPRQ